MAIINNDFKVKNGLVVGTTATILSTTQSASTNTGALIVPGGAGIGKNLYVGGTVVAQGYDLMSYDGSVHYVSDSIGNDSNDGHRLISAYKSIKHALTQAQSGDKVFIEAGTYYEQFPLTVPQGVSVRGAGLRAVTVYPTTATNTQTAFLLNGECYISDFTVTGFYKPGNAFEFAPGAKITTRSPYVERFSVITRGSNPTANDPYGYDSGNAGNGAYLDAGVLDPTSLEPAMLWNEATFIVPNATGFYMTNGARAELLNGFVYFADKAIRAETGTVGYGGVGKTRLKLSGVSGTFTAGDTIIYKSSTGTVLASGIISSTVGGYIFLDGPVWGFETFTDASTSTQVVYSAGVSPSTATSIVLADYHQFGAELRCIGSAAVFGNQGVIANGTGTDLKLIAFNLSAIGSGKDLSDDFSLTVQSNEIIQTNGGKIYYQTVDQYGDFRVGDKFLVNQRTGDVSFNSATINLSNLSSLVISDGINSTTLTPGNIVVGSLNFAGNTISSQSGNITIDPSGTLTTINSDATINGNTVINSTAQSNSTNSGALTVGGGVGIGGNLYVGGTMYGSFFGSLSGVATTATNLYLGTAGQIPYQSSPSQTTYTGPGNAGDILVSRGTAGPVFQNTLTLSSSTYSITTTTGNALQVVGGIGAGYIYVTNSGWIAGSEIVTTATIGNSFAGAPVTNPFQITSTANNALVVGGGAIIGGNVVIGGTVQFNGTSTVINSTSVDIGNKLIYLSTLSNSAIEAIGSGFIIGSNPLSSTNTNTWASLTFDGGTPGNWIIGNGLMPTLDDKFNIGDPLKRWSILYANTVTSARINGTEVRDNSNRVITSVTPSGGTGIGISGITTTGPAASFTVENLGVTSATGTTYIGVSSNTGSIVIENLGVQSLTGSTHIGVSSSTGTITLTNLGVTSLTSGTDISLSATTGSITVNNISTLQSVTSRGGTTNNGITITNATPAFDSTSGALLVTGGVGIQGRLYAGNIYSNGSQVLTSAGGGYVITVSAGTDTAVTTSTGNVIVYNTSTFQSITNRGATTTNAISITNTTASTGTTTGALVVEGGLGVGGAIYAQSTSYIGAGKILTSVDLETVTFAATYITNDPTSQTGLAAIANTTTVYGTYNFGTVTDIQTINDYNTGTNTGFYSINDATGAPAYVVYIGFSNVTDFTRLVLNLNYTAASGHTVEIDLYNYVTLTWDTLTTYSGSTNWFQFILSVIDSAPYLSGGKVTARIYHVSPGSTTHRTWIDYAALENSVQGGQGPRGATGATGAQGVQGLTTTTTSTFLFNNYTNSTSTNSGAVVAYGGVGIGKDVYVGGSINVTQNSYIAGSQIITTATVNQYASQTAIFAGTDTAVNTSTGNVTVWNTSTLQTVTSRGATTNNAISITNTTASTGTTTGALTITGGVGIGGDLYVGTVYSNGQQVVTSTSSNTSFVSAIIAGTDTRVSTSTGVVTVWNDSTLQTVTGRGNSTTNAVIITNATNSINTTSGALIVTGGAAFGKNLWVGGTLNVNGSEVITTSTIGASGVTSITAGTDTAISTSTGDVTIWNTSTLQTITSRGATSNVAVSITNTTAANATNSGALQVVGGVGIGGNLYVGGEIVAEKLTIQLTTVTTTQVTTDDIISTYNTTNASSTNSGALQIAGGAGIGSDLWVGGTIYRNGISVGYGYSGSLGYTGSAGFTGSQGTAGYDGSVGYAGSKGDAGYNGSVGYTGSQGTAGYNGSAGFTGSQGAAGYNGSVGYTGSRGTAGYNGSVGYTGSQGAAGYNGSVGYTGSQGTAGYNGSVGYTGSKGDAGYNGSVGFTGSRGAAGYNGSVGYTGSQGTAGYNGSVGYTGSQGAAGYNGSVGYTGSQGAAGYNGSVGYTGSQGAAGYNGSVGFTGSKGDIGYAGSAGPSNIINATAATTGIMYPVMVPATGSNQTAYADTGLYYDTNANALYISGEIIADKLTIQLTTVTTTLVTTDDIIRTTNTTASTSTNSGALQISGGAGIGGDVYSYSLFPSADNVGVVGNTAATWSNGQFTNLTIDSTLNVRAAIDLADSDVLRFGSSDDAYFVYNGTPNTFELQLETDAVSFIITDNGTTRYTFDKTGVLTLSNSTSVSSTNTGALIVAGGVGIGGGLFVGGITTATILRTPATEIALGNGAGNTGQGSNAIAIGQGAGQTNQPANSIILNASGSTLDGTNAGTYISPIRADATTSASTYIVYYNPTTKEMTTATSGGSTLATSATNVAVTNEIASAAPHYLTFVTTSTGYAGIKTAAVSGIVYQPSRSALALGSVGPVDSDSWAGAIMDVKGPIYARQSNGTSYISLATYLNTSYISAQGATNKMVFQTASSEKMRITTVGYVGIGQSAPATLLSNSATRQANADGISTHLSSINWQVSGQGYAAAISNTSVAAANTNSGLLVALASTDATDKILDLESGGVNRVRVLGNGKVGIGNTGPSYMLDVASTSRLGASVTQGSPSATDITANSTLLLSGNGGNYLSFGQSATGPQAQWIQSGYTNPTTAVYPISLNPLGGNVGIGILNPISRFVVNGGAVDTTTYTSAQARIADGTIHLMKTSAGGVFEAVRAMNLDTTAGTTVRLLAAATSDAFNNANGGKVFIDAIRTSTNMDLAFLLNSASGAAPVERVRFMGSGNVGIGTNAPAATLHVVGTESRFGGVASGYISVYDASARVGYIQANGGTDLRIAAEGASNPMTFYVNASERARITTSGNFGIGTVTPQYKLDVNNGILASDSFQASFGSTISAGYWSGIHFGYSEAANTSYRKSAIVFERQDSSARGKIHILNNGTASGATATLADAKITVLYDGNVGVGTTTPYYKLEVNGSFAATTKSFVIDHPTKPGMKLRYGSLEGPENGVYVRGKLTGSNKIELPDYWTKLVDPDSITVSLTSIGKHQDLYVADISNNVITIGNGNILSKAINCYYVIYGERCDVEKLEVEITHGR